MHHLCPLEKVSRCGLIKKQSTAIREKDKIPQLENSKAEHFDLQIFLFPFGVQTDSTNPDKFMNNFSLT